MQGVLHETLVVVAASSVFCSVVDVYFCFATDFFPQTLEQPILKNVCCELAPREVD